MSYNPFSKLAGIYVGMGRQSFAAASQERAARRAAEKPAPAVATATKAQTYEGDYILTPDWAAPPPPMPITVDPDAPLPPRSYEAAPPAAVAPPSPAMNAAWKGGAAAALGLAAWALYRRRWYLAAGAAVAAVIAGRKARLV
jgi:hypothetical protein